MSNHATATLGWNGSEVSVDLTCSCGVVRSEEIGMDDLVECKVCRRVWRPLLVVVCAPVTDEAEIREFRRRYYGEGR